MPSFIPAVVPVLYDVVLVRGCGEGGVEDGLDVAQRMSPQLRQIWFYFISSSTYHLR